MSTTKNHIALLENLLNQSKQDKLMYLNTADRQHLPTIKRHLNHQALLRNNMFNQLSSILSNHGADLDDLLLRRPNMRQLMMTTPKRDKKNPFVQCVEQDERFKANLVALADCDSSESNLLLYRKMIEKIEDSIQSNILYRDAQVEKVDFSSDLLQNGEFI